MGVEARFEFSLYRRGRLLFDVAKSLFIRRMWGFATLEMLGLGIREGHGDEMRIMKRDLDLVPLRNF